MDDIIREKPWFKKIYEGLDKNNLMLKTLYEFYLIDNRIDKIIPIITSNSNISIRLLDWFVTNYAKKYNIIYETTNKDTMELMLFNVYLQYKLQLKGYKKKLFDPFCRNQRIPFYYTDNKCIITTLGQLNFFKWALKHDILEYVNKNIDHITNDMINTNKTVLDNYSIMMDKTKINNKTNNLTINKTSNNTNKNSNSLSDSPNSSERKKRHELSKSASKSLWKYDYNITLTFE